MSGVLVFITELRNGTDMAKEEEEEEAEKGSDARVGRERVFTYKWVMKVTLAWKH